LASVHRHADVDFRAFPHLRHGVRDQSTARRRRAIQDLFHTPLISAKIDSPPAHPVACPTEPANRNQLPRDAARSHELTACRDGRNPGKPWSASPERIGAKVPGTDQLQTVSAK